MPRLLELIFSVPKSLYVSARLCGLKKALKLPVVVRYNTVLRNLSGSVECANGARFAVGFSDGEGTLDKRYVRSVIEISGKISINGNVNLGCGTRLCVEGTLTIGSMSNSSRLQLVCRNNITVGRNFRTAWGACIMDSDMHEVINLQTGKVYNASKKVVIGDNVWAGTRSLILKGSVIPDGCIIAATSVVNKRFDVRNALLAGNPAVVKKEGITRYFDQGFGLEYIKQELSKNGVESISFNDHS